MKRIICLSFILSLIIGMFSFPVYAAEPSYENRHTLAEVHWTDEDGNPLSEEMIERISNAIPIRKRAEFCCSPNTMRKVIFIEELHNRPAGYTYCVVARWELVVCAYCNARWSRTYVGEYSHYHIG